MIPYGKQTIGEDSLNAVLETLKSPFLTSGPKVKEFEKAIAKTAKVKYAVAVTNGTLALDLAVSALNLKKDFLGVTVPLTFAASANCILYNQGRLGLVDIDSKYPSMSPSSLKEFIKNKGEPNVIIPVSYAGIPANLPELYSLAREHDFKLIEDAAHSFGSEYTHEGKHYMSGSCEHSDLAIFSFHPVKNITTAEGGVVTTHSEELYHRLLCLREHGIKRNSSSEPWAYDICTHGVNGRLSDIHCSLGLSQLNFLNEFKVKRKAIVDQYNIAFDREGLMIPNEFPFECDPFFHIYPLRLRGEDVKKKRLDLFNFLLTKNIRPQVHYVPIHHHTYFKALHPLQVSLLNSENYYNSVISLPLFPSLTVCEQDLVIESVLDFLAKN